MDINAIRKEIQEQEERVRTSLEYLEYLKNLLAHAEQAQDTNTQPSAGSDTTESPTTSLKYDNKNLSAFVIHSEQLEYLLNKSHSIKEFLHKLYQSIKHILTTDPSAIDYIRHKCYPQIKLKMEFQHEKAYNPEIDTATPVFYNEGYCKRDYLIQDTTDIDRVIPKIMEKLDAQIDNFIWNGSNWSLVRPIKCTIKLIKQCVYEVTRAPRWDCARPAAAGSRFFA
jgi:hypothetical protein